MRQPGERRGAYPAGEEDFASEGKCRDDVHYGQAVRDDGDLQRSGSGGIAGDGAAAGAFLRQDGFKNRDFTNKKVEENTAFLFVKPDSKCLKSAGFEVPVV